jgi:ketosteroid isomerase-like protein
MTTVHATGGARARGGGITALACLAAASLCGPSVAVAQDDARAADHQALVTLREQFTAALNGRDFEALKPLVTESMTFVSISNERIDGIGGLKAYWDRLFEGGDSVLESMTVAPVADEQTEFFGDSLGVTQGTSQDEFVFRGAGRRALTTRWTAVVEKSGGQW